jgi:hypothetical protein
MLQNLVFWSGDNWKDSAAVKEILQSEDLSFEQKTAELLKISNDSKFSRNTNPKTRFHFNKTVRGDDAKLTPIVMGTKINPRRKGTV